MNFYNVLDDMFSEFEEYKDIQKGKALEVL